MHTPRQFVRAGIAAMQVSRRLQPILLVAALCLCAASSWAETQPPGAVARVEGKDISVENAMSAGSGVSQSQSAPGAFVSNGSIVTVHSGHARMTLFAGGHVEICGPAKFTLLQTSDAITLAINFGRVQVQLPAASSLRVFTPTIIATPLGISGGERDVAVGLSLDDSLCVRATTGAIQLEHQFSGEKLIVPQAGEFFLNAGQLLPVAGTPGSCECDASDASPIVVPDTLLPARPDYAVVVSRPSAPAKPAASASACRPARRSVRRTARIVSLAPIPPPADPAKARTGFRSAVAC